MTAIKTQGTSSLVDIDASSCIFQLQALTNISQNKHVPVLQKYILIRVQSSNRLEFNSNFVQYIASITI